MVQEHQEPEPATELSLFSDSGDDHHAAPPAAEPEAPPIPGVAEASAIVEVTPPAPAAAAARPRTADWSGLEALSYGPFLRELRRRTGLTNQELEQETQIRAAYLDALEEEELSSLPPLVYVLAYVRKLCAFYGVPREKSDDLTQELRRNLECECEIPEELSKVVIDRELSEENDRKLKQLLFCFGGVGLLVVLLLVGSVIFMLSRRASEQATPAGPGEPFNEAALLELQTPPTLTPGQLPMPIQ